MVVSEIMDRNMTLVRPQNAENTDPRTNYAARYATARGHLRRLIQRKDQYLCRSELSERFGSH